MVPCNNVAEATGPSYAQVAIKTEKSARQLQWLRSERIVQMNEKERLAEQTAYQEALAAAMEGKTV
uniref:Uncharacterized protein n=1 Tax=Eubacterium cellulosolvens (strain ATCC 43171 / JCM 9499 / 6) TaxID=633697 RepID=I5AXC9_EUBC6